MHEPMYDHPGVLDAIGRVESWGVSFVDPRVEEGKAKVATEDAIALAAARAATTNPLAGDDIVVTSGATAESVDPVRVLTNRSSGRTGRAVARACYVRGADVTLVHAAVGPHEVTAEGAAGDGIPYADLRTVERTSELLEATLDAAADADALVSAAAVGDFTVDASDEKIRSGESVTLDLVPTPKVIDEVREANPDRPIVGFKAETSGDDDAMVDAARETLNRAGLAFVVANDASVMGESETRALIVRSDETSEFTGSKERLGGRIAEELAAELR
jgi:phosphopantothenoylcysteine decarboxylase/phosphopantothenate--cysteine ligase